MNRNYMVSRMVVIAGTYLEHKFQAYLHTNYEYKEGSSAKGIDFPDSLVDMKVTSIKQPQSSCPFTSARQKIFGLKVFPSRLCIRKDR